MVGWLTVFGRVPALLAVVHRRADGDFGDPAGIIVFAQIGAEVRELPEGRQEFYAIPSGRKVPHPGEELLVQVLGLNKREVGGLRVGI